MRVTALPVETVETARSGVDLSAYRIVQ